MEALVWRERLAHLDVDVDATHRERRGRGKYWDMYRAIMRNDFAKASLHADSALAADDQLALAYLAKMIEAAWITGSADDYRAAYNTATELVAEDDYAAVHHRSDGTERRRAHRPGGKALMHSPDDPLLIAWTAFWLGDDTDQSIQMIKRGMERWPYMAAFHNLMGYRLMQKEDMEGALAHFELQTRLLPDAANPWDSLGDYHVEAGNTEEARKAFEKASKSILRLTPPSASLRNSTAPTPIPDS